MRISDWSSDVCSSDLSLRLSHPSSRGLHHHHRLHRYRSTRAERNLSARKSASAGGASNFSLPTFSPIPLGICCSISTRPVRSEEHTSELQSIMRISYDVLCLKTDNNRNQSHKTQTHNKRTNNHHTNN